MVVAILLGVTQLVRCACMAREGVDGVVTRGGVFGGTTHISRLFLR